MSENQYDVAIIGAGIAGCATALALTMSGYKTIILERRSAIEDRPGETVPATICRPLQTLHLWTTFKALNPRPSYATASAWGTADFETRSSIFDALGQGWHIDRRRFDAALWASVEVNGVVLVRDVQDFKLARDDKWRVSWEVGRKGCSIGRPAVASVSARFVVDASGRGRALARKLGHRAHCYDRLVGWACYVSRNEEQEAVTVIEAAPDGWWYSAPLPLGRAVVMYMTDADLSSRERVLSRLTDDADHCVSLQRFGVTPDAWRPRPFGAATGHLAPAAGDGWIAVGDAASAYDPLSAQGILMAFLSGLRAAEAIAAWLHGSRRECADYALMQSAKFGKYLSLRTKYYRMERRWSDRPFWCRRNRARTWAANLPHLAVDRD